MHLLVDLLNPLDFCPPALPTSYPLITMSIAHTFQLCTFFQVWRESTAQLREAADLFRRAADSGIGDASYQLGRLYQQGLGIPLDPVAAFENFLAAADGKVVHPTAGEAEGWSGRRGKRRGVERGRRAYSNGYLHEAV